MYAANQDYYYLIMALSSGGCNVTNPQSRVSLQKLGYMTPAKIRDKWNNGNIQVHGMALTKKGQRRAQEIADQLAKDRHERIHRRDRRGIAGAAYPKSWKLDKRGAKRPITYESFGSRAEFKELSK
jgi:hypothetical protein